MKKSKLIKTLASISAVGIISAGVTAATLTSCGNPTGDKAITIYSASTDLIYNTATTISGSIVATNFTLGACTLTGNDAAKFDLDITGSAFTLTRKSQTLAAADYTITITDTATNTVSNPLTIHVADPIAKSLTLSSSNPNLTVDVAGDVTISVTAANFTPTSYSISDTTNFELDSATNPTKISRKDVALVADNYNVTLTANGVTSNVLTIIVTNPIEKSLTISSTNTNLVYDTTNTISGTITATNFTLGACTLTGNDAAKFDLDITGSAFTLTRKSQTLAVADYTITITDTATNTVSNPLTIHIQNTQQQLGGDFSPSATFGTGGTETYTSSAGTTTWSFVGSAPDNNIAIGENTGVLAWTNATPANTYSFTIQSVATNYTPATLNITLTITDADLLIADATWFAGYPAIIGWQAGKDAEVKAAGYTKIIFPADVTSIAGLQSSVSMAAGGTISEIQIAGTNTSIGTSAFDGCANLVDVDASLSAGSIGTSAFHDCVNLESFASKSISIGNYAFDRCASLDVDASSFGTLAIIGSYAFSGCASLTTTGVKALNLNPAYTKVSSTNGVAIYKTASTTACADGCLYVGDISSIAFPIPLQDTATSIGTEAFSGCASLTKVIFTSLSSTSIGNFAFYGCANLIYIGFGSITTASIGTSAFNGCDQPTGTIAAATHAGAVTIRDQIAAVKSNFTNWSVYPTT